MYRINQQTNSIQKIEETTFKDIGATERYHLQEWIAKNPEVLCGEDEKLLIIQKEFAGFSDTKERLDLLALDQDGNLVIIENKLDDSGRDVTWQGLKYASYCSTLTTNQIITIYQQYLNSEGIDGDAEQLIREGLDFEDGELLLNSGDQRLVFIAHKFRKEVTSTVLWLIDRGVQIKCFKAVPFKLINEMLLQIEQIIPLPETEELIIQMQEKQRSESQSKKINGEREDYYEALWKKVKFKLTEHGIDSFGTTTGRHYLRYSNITRNMHFVMVATLKFCRVEVYCSSDSDSSTLLALKEYEAQIPESLSNKLEWQLLEGKNASRLKLEIPYAQLSPEAYKASSKYEVGELEEHIVNWFTEAAPEFLAVLKPLVKKVSALNL